MFRRPRTSSSRARAPVVSAMASHHLVGERQGRDDAGRIARMYARLLDVLHDRADVDVDAVGDGVHVDLDGVLEEIVHQDRVLRGKLHRRRDVVPQAVLVVDDRHGAAAQHVAGAHEHRVADPAGDAYGLLLGEGDAVFRLQQAELPHHLREALPVLGPVDRIGRGAEYLHAVLLEARAPGAAGVWPPNCTITPSGFSRSYMWSTSSRVSGSK